MRQQAVKVWPCTTAEAALYSDCTLVSSRPSTSLLVQGSSASRIVSPPWRATMSPAMAGAAARAAHRRTNLMNILPDGERNNCAAPLGASCEPRAGIFVGLEAHAGSADGGDRCRLIGGREFASCAQR